MVDRVEMVPLAGYNRVASWPGQVSRIGKALWHFTRAKPLGALGGGFVVLLVFVALFADMIAPYDYNKRNLRERLAPPSLSHLMGTDNLGRDVFTRVVYGARVSVSVGFGGIGMGVLLASLAGITSGHFCCGVWLQHAGRCPARCVGSPLAWELTPMSWELSKKEYPMQPRPAMSQLLPSDHTRRDVLKGSVVAGAALAAGVGRALPSAEAATPKPGGTFRVRAGTHAALIRTWSLHTAPRPPQALSTTDCFATRRDRTFPLAIWLWRETWSRAGRNLTM
jgi:hypothetical protein